MIFKAPELEDWRLESNSSKDSSGNGIVGA
jgi:hypothetical protein